MKQNLIRAANALPLPVDPSRRAARDVMPTAAGSFAVGVMLAAAAVGQSLVRNINPVQSSDPHGGVAIRELYYFVADSGRSGSDGSEVFFANDTNNLVSMIRDINPGGSSSPRELTVMDLRLYFVAFAPDHGTELWRCDAPVANTNLVLDLAPGTASSDPNGLRVYRDRLYFSADEGVHGRQLWRTDGTAAGTERVAPGVVGAGAAVVNPTVAHDLLYWSSGATLWSTDGTPAGTRVVDPGYGPGTVLQHLAAADGLLFYVVDEPTQSRVSLHRTDGTPAGTFEVAAFNYPERDRLIDQPHPIGGVVYFRADLGADSGLWRSNGTPTGTLRLFAGPVRGVTVAKDRVFFLPLQDPLGREPWVSDGTSAGTNMIADLHAGPNSSLTELAAFYPIGTGRHVAFPANDGVNGSGVWRSDGSSDGTRLCPWVGTSATSPEEFVQVSSLVFFSAHALGTGRELYVMPTATLEAPAVDPWQYGCAGTGGLVPVLRGRGSPELGTSDFSWELSDGLPDALALLCLSDHYGGGRVGDCNKSLNLPVAWAASVLDATGAATFTMPIPAAANLIGLRYFLQALVIDPEGTLLGVASASTATSMIIGR